jgi:UDP-glucuronate 4-epimerase
MKQFRLGYAEPCCNEVNDMNKTLLVTGAAGFIGSHVTQALLIRGDTVVGVDNLNDYYDPARKSANVAEMQLA